MRSLWMAIVLVLAPSVVAAQGTISGTGDTPSHEATVSILSLMSRDEFGAAGLTKLSQAELLSLSRWVRAHTLLVAQLARTAALSPEPAPSSNPGVIETRMAGDFTGWDGSTVFHFANGQLWQQSSFGNVYQFARSPKVTLVATGNGWRLQVEGVPQSIQVRRLR